MNTSVNDNYRTSPRRDWDNDVIWQIKMLNYRKRIDCNANISTEQTADLHKNIKRKFKFFTQPTKAQRSENSVVTQRYGNKQAQSVLFVR